MKPPCDLYEAEFKATFTVKVAAPPGTPPEEVRKRGAARRAEITAWSNVEWNLALRGPDDGDASDADRHTWIVDDARTGLVKGEETAWLPDTPGLGVKPAHQPECSCVPCVLKRREVKARTEVPFTRGGFVIDTHQDCTRTCLQHDCWSYGLGCAIFTGRPPQ